ncbi:cation:proton antiporter [Pleomorphovibrio marinus]|uniref:cation:proton antiporter n=1 Tax=Pleomorphovibrio marinus TaxID=2164132 RepID=UPI000E0AC1BF|nr:cation:proton antiporter [Pleomorphovibrio marinus]
MLEIDNIFIEFSVILLIATVAGLVARLLKQPLIVAFIAVGILVGPSAFDLVQSKENVYLLAELGISILLFVVGLKLDVGLIKSTGKVALFSGLGQVIFTSVFGFLIALGLGFEPITSLYIAVALTFSSTIIIVKLLSDKKEIDALHGQIAIGFLIVQDIVVVIAMIILSALGAEGTGASPGMEVVWVVVKALGMVALTFLLMKYVMPSLVKLMAKSQELLVLFAIAYAVTFAALGDIIGFSQEVGAFLAGISLASTSFREVISGRLTTIRDFLLLFFFIDLGLQIDLSLMGAALGSAVIFSMFVLIGNPIIVMVIMGLLGYRKRTGFLAGLTVAQISEFSLILVSLGLSLGHIDEATMGLVTLVGLITIGLSTYLIIYSHQIFEKLSPFLSIFEKKAPFAEQNVKLSEHPKKVDVIVFGIGRFGSNLLKSFDKKGLSVMGVDFDPQLVSEWQKSEIKVYYGDAEDPELLEQLPLSESKFFVSTLAVTDSDTKLWSYLQKKNYQGSAYFTVHRASQAESLQKLGAKHFLYPYADAGYHIADRLLHKHIDQSEKVKVSELPDED